ncbi:ABC transporter ATP-binding protein [Candidatus Thorarchaeota archaeon]|nr:MAG: ABC transporter ATP-binding protein [Candidatus Thorarchaeota archaeon]
MTIPDNLVLHVKDLFVNFYTYEGVVKALDGVQMFLRRGDTMGVVGETGCGKSVTAKAILRLVESPGKIEEGNILFYGKDPETKEMYEQDIVALEPEQMLEIRGNKISIVFQDPATYPNPVFRIGDQIAEVVELHQDLSLDVLHMKIAKLELALSEMISDENRAEIEQKIAYYKQQLDDPPEPDKKSRKEAAKLKAIEMLRLVRMPTPEHIANQYPHELSGGMRQRALIAMSLACNPSILICDEATTALDVTVQAQVLSLLNQLKKEIGTSIIVITHDMGVVAETCNWVNVMYAGTTVESCSTKELFSRPIHPYTEGLLVAVPKLHEVKDRLPQIRGNVPNLITPPPGCRFHPRCNYATNICKEEKPLLEEIEQNHWVACHHPLTGQGGSVNE